MTKTTEQLKEEHIRFCEEQHLLHFLQGYRESILTSIYGEKRVEEKFDIDVSRYSPGGARDVSYQEGWAEALNDFKQLP